MNKRKIITSAATGILGLGLVVATPAFAMAAPAPSSVSVAASASAAPATPNLFDKVDRYGHYSYFSVRTSQQGVVVVRNAEGETLQRSKANANQIVYVGLNHFSAATLSVTLERSQGVESAPLLVELPTPDAALVAPDVFTSSLGQGNTRVTVTAANPGAVVVRAADGRVVAQGNIATGIKLTFDARQGSGSYTATLTSGSETAVSAFRL